MNDIPSIVIDFTLFLINIIAAWKEKLDWIRKELLAKGIPKVNTMNIPNGGKFINNQRFKTKLKCIKVQNKE